MRPSGMITVLRKPSGLPSRAGQKLHFDLVPGMERIRSGLAVPAPGRAPPLGSDGQQAGGHADRPQIPKFA